MRPLNKCFWNIFIHRWANFKQYYWCAETYEDCGASNADDQKKPFTFCQAGYSLKYNDCLESANEFMLINNFKQYVIDGEVEL